jgi:nucleotide-binding universal stress UspA family protein
MIDAPNRPRIVLGFDARSGGEDAAALAALLATSKSAVLAAIIVPLPPRVIGDPPIKAAAGARTWQDVCSDLEHQGLEALAERALPLLSGLEVESTAILDDSTARALTWLCEREKADMLVIGSTHRGTLGRLAAGTTAERLLNGSPCPVALAPRGFAEAERGPIETVGVGYDGSEVSALAVQAAAELALEHGAELQLISVVDPDSHAEARVLGEALDALTGQGLRDRRADQAREAAERILDELPAALRRTVEIVHGDPVETLQARSSSLDLLVVGARGYGALRRVLLGSVSIGLTRVARCPVIVARGA